MNKIMRTVAAIALAGGIVASGATGASAHSGSYHPGGLYGYESSCFSAGVRALGSPVTSSGHAHTVYGFSCTLIPGQWLLRLYFR